MSHRLFIAIRPPAGVRDALLDTMDGVEGARWQDEDQLHLTLRFVGEVERPLAEDIAEALAGLHFPAFELVLADVGAFERKGAAHTLWAGVAPSEPLVLLQRKIERLCQKLGLPAEKLAASLRMSLWHGSVGRAGRSAAFWRSTWPSQLTAGV